MLLNKIIFSKKYNFLCHCNWSVKLSFKGQNLSTWTLVDVKFHSSSEVNGAMLIFTGWGSHLYCVHALWLDFGCVHFHSKSTFGHFSLTNQQRISFGADTRNRNSRPKWCFSRLRKWEVTENGFRMEIPSPPSLELCCNAVQQWRNMTFWPQPSQPLVFKPSSYDSPDMNRGALWLQRGFRIVAKCSVQSVPWPSWYASCIREFQPEWSHRAQLDQGS